MGPLLLNLVFRNAVADFADMTVSIKGLTRSVPTFGTQAWPPNDKN